MTIIVLQVLLITCVMCANLTLGQIICEDRSGSFQRSATLCLSSQYCCGLFNDQCCSYSSSSDQSNKSFVSGNHLAAEFFSAVIAFGIFFLCCVCCYRCCCNRTASSGVVYSTPNTTGASVTLPPQQGGGMTVQPYPQQTSYPMPTPMYQPQPASNPYLDMPPPPYHTVVQEGSKQASATAPTFRN